MDSIRAKMVVVSSGGRRVAKLTSKSDKWLGEGVGFT
jgi:hypothetical protein